MTISLTVMDTTLFRGKGAQRIRKVIRMNVQANDHYVLGQGYSNPDGSGLPSLGSIIPSTIRNAVARTLEPRILDEVSCGFLRHTFFDDRVILDVDSLDIGLQSSTKKIGIRAYGVLEAVPPVSGLTESPGVEGLTHVGACTIMFELEYTPHSGQEG